MNQDPKLLAIDLNLFAFVPVWEHLDDFRLSNQTDRVKEQVDSPVRWACHGEVHYRLSDMSWILSKRP